MIGGMLRASLGVFDEAALVTLASAGLYRRAARDVAEGKTTILEASGEAAIVEADGQRVEIDARGPKAARCSCKALGICRHRIAAVLLLQAKASEVAADAREGVSFDPAGMLAAMERGAIERWAGKAAWRAALKLAESATTVTVEGNAIVVSFADVPDPVRILRGQEMDGIVSRIPGDRRKTWHAAAMLAARRHFDLDESEESVPRTPAMADETLPDLGVLRQVESSLADCLAFAFNLAPAPIEERLLILSVSSRADVLPRLGRLLRSLAAQLRLKRERSFTFDPDLSLETLVTVHALVRALEGVNASTDPLRRRLLYGQRRQNFDLAEPLTLVGCGTDQWRTDSGARGVTGIFYDQGRDRWFTYAHARGPGQDPLFDPEKAYSASAIWGGVTLQQLAGATFTLDGAGVSEEGRLSNPRHAAARIERDVSPNRSAWPARFGDWVALSQRLSHRFGLGLARRTSPDFALLAPRRFAQPYFDDLAQELVWPVEDGRGNWLGLTLARGEGGPQMIERVEGLGRSGWRGEVVVRASQSAGRMQLAPIAVFDGHSSISLALDSTKSPARNGKWWSELRLRLNPLLGRGGFRRSPASATMATLSAAWQCLIDLAESGPDRARPALLGGVRDCARQLDRLGQPNLAGRLLAVADNPRAHFMAAGYALLLARDQRISMPTLIWTR